jgi:DNA-binding SARP family transcriptional activator
VVTTVTAVRILGPPRLERGGAPARPPRGRKSWALLAYLLLARRPVGRSHLAELLFADADDPLGALRWTLAELRRALGRPEALAGDPVDPALPGLDVDLTRITGSDAHLDDDGTDDSHLLLTAGELLEGVQLPACPEFESWLLVARHRTSAAVEGRLRQAALARLAGGRAADAVPLAERMLARDPLAETNHELLVRCLAASGDPVAARQHVDAATERLRRELGVDASPALREAASATPAHAHNLPLSGRWAALGQLEAGRAAIAAGAVDGGLQCLRRAVAEAGPGPDARLRATTLVALGSALVHAVRGRDSEGALVLHEALRQAELAGDPALAATALRELAVVEVQAGRGRPRRSCWSGPRTSPRPTTSARPSSASGGRAPRTGPTTPPPWPT